MEPITDPLLTSIDENPNLRSDKATCERLAASLHTFYIRGENYEKEIMNIIGKSKLVKERVLMPAQFEMLYFIKNNKNVILSAPTSFGKSFVVLEYIKTLDEPKHLIVYIVHTKALCSEVFGNMNKFFKDSYNVINDLDSYEPQKNNIIVIISDGQNIYDLLKVIDEIDILIIDEAYNLGENTEENSRFLTIFNTCHELMKHSKKNILIGPFISSFEDYTSDNYNFKFFKSTYSPVTERLFEGEKLIDNEPSSAFIRCLKSNQNTIGFINSKNKIYTELENISQNEDLKSFYSDAFIDWMKSFFPDFWTLPKLMEKGIAVYHSSFPKYLNLYGMNLFNKGTFKGLLTTSAILEGVNTAAKNIVIYETTSGRREQIKLTPFQFFNLCGRAGRLNKEIVGNIYNFGDSFERRYNEKSLILKIGTDDDSNETRFNLGIRDETTECIETLVKNELIDIGIEYDEWYDKNKFYFGNDYKKLLKQLKIYKYFRESFKTFVNVDGMLSDKRKNTLKKPDTLKYIYNNYITPIDSNFKQGYRLPVVTLIDELIRSKNGGLIFSLKQFCESSFVYKNCAGPDKESAVRNQFIVTTMKIAYDYLQYEFNYCNTLLKEFISHDNYFDDEERKRINEAYFNRLNNYLLSNNEKKITKYMNDLGIIPPLISKIISLIDFTDKDLSSLKSKEIYKLVFDAVHTNISSFERFELINLVDVGIIESF